MQPTARGHLLEFFTARDALRHAGKPLGFLVGLSRSCAPGSAVRVTSPGPPGAIGGSGRKHHNEKIYERLIDRQKILDSGGPCPLFCPACRCVCVRSRRRPRFSVGTGSKSQCSLSWDRCIMWKLTTATASIFLLAACDTTGSIQREQLEQLERAKAEIEAYSEIDDAKCRNYGMPGSSTYDKCRTSAMNARMNARGSGASK